MHKLSTVMSQFATELGLLRQAWPCWFYHFHLLGNGPLAKNQLAIPSGKEFILDWFKPTQAYRASYWGLPCQCHFCRSLILDQSHATMTSAYSGDSLNCLEARENCWTTAKAQTIQQQLQQPGTHWRCPLVQCQSQCLQTVTLIFSGNHAISVFWRSISGTLSWSSYHTNPHVFSDTCHLTSLNRPCETEKWL